MLISHFLSFRCQEEDDSATPPILQKILDILYATEVSPNENLFDLLLLSSVELIVEDGVPLSRIINFILDFISVVHSIEILIVCYFLLVFPFAVRFRIDRLTESNRNGFLVALHFY